MPGGSDERSGTSIVVISGMLTPVHLRQKWETLGTSRPSLFERMFERKPQIPQAPGGLEQAVVTVNQTKAAKAT